MELCKICLMLLYQMTDVRAINKLKAASNWFSEVLELRRRADEHRKRAYGTHFSRDHLAQLYAKNAELWDTVSNSTVLSAVSLDGREKSLEGREETSLGGQQTSNQQRLAFRLLFHKFMQFSYHIYMIII